MSASEHRPGVRLEEDVLPGRVIVAVMAATVVVFGAGVIWAGVETRRHRDPEPATPAVEAQREIGLVPQSQFATDRNRDRLHDAAARRLESWDWVDRGKGIVRMPIRDAMDFYIAEQAK